MHVNRFHCASSCTLKHGFGRSHHRRGVFSQSLSFVVKLLSNISMSVTKEIGACRLIQLPSCMLSWTSLRDLNASNNKLRSPVFGRSAHSLLVSPLTTPRVSPRAAVIASAVLPGQPNAIPSAVWPNLAFIDLSNNHIVDFPTDIIIGAPRLQVSICFRLRCVSSFCRRGSQSYASFRIYK